MKSELEHATMDASDQVREASYLEHEIEEIRSAELKIGEDEELENRYRLMKNSEKIAASLNRIEGMLSEDNAAADLVGRSLSELTQVASFDEEGLKDILSSLTDIDGLLSDLTRDLADYRDAMEFDQEEFSVPAEGGMMEVTFKTNAADSLQLYVTGSLAQYLEDTRKKDSTKNTRADERKAYEGNLKWLRVLPNTDTVARKGFFYLAIGVGNNRHVSLDTLNFYQEAFVPDSLLSENP